MTETAAEKPILRISFSQLSTYRQCPHKWYLNYLLKLPGDESEELIFGSVLHTTIESILTNSLFQKMYKVSPNSTVKDIFKSALKSKLKEISDVTLLKKIQNNNLASIFMYQAEKLIVELDYFNRFKQWDVHEVEYKLDGLTIAENDDCKIVFKGFIDLILKHKTEDTYLILDWKTSVKQWDIIQKLKSNKDFFAQLCLYKHFYSSEEKIPFENIETKFYNLPRGEPTKQGLYNGNLKKEYVDDYVSKFIETCFTMFKHKEEMTPFTKIKMVSKENYCFRCKYNTEKLCNDTEEFQKVIIV